MFRKGDKIIYPIHGIARITKIEKIKFDGKEKSYYKLEFPAKKLTISIPVENAEKVGLRKPLTKSTLTQKLNNLNENTNYKNEEFNDLNKTIEGLLNSGKFNDSIEIVKLITQYKEIRKKDGKLLTNSCRSYLIKAKEILREEVKLVLGEEAIKAYGLD